MTGITWLHLSDWHEGAEKKLKKEAEDYLHYNRDIVRKKLIEDIKNIKQTYQSLPDFDFIIFSGDIAFSGEREQYERAYQDLFEPILKATKLTADELFIVPGNHDLDRSKLKSLRRDLPDRFSSEDQVREWLTDEADKKKLDDLLEPFSEFKQFVTQKHTTKYAREGRPDYAYTLKLNINNKKVGFLGLNSALMAGREDSPKGEVDDEAHLVVGEPQIDPPVLKIKNDDIRIAVLHHPLEWLSKFERSLINKLLREHFHFVLCGHEHRTEIDQAIGSEGECIFIPASASFDRRNFPNGYNFVHLDLDEGRGKVFFRRWSNRRRKWVRDEDTCDRGEYTIKQLPERLGVQSGVQSKRLEPRTVSRLQPVVPPVDENHYNDLIRDIMDGLVVPFLGPDINLCDRDENLSEESNPWDWDVEGPYPPTYLELAAHIDKAYGERYLEQVRCPLCDKKDLPPDCPINTQFVSRMDLQHVSQYLGSRERVGKLIDAINEVHSRVYEEPNSLHHLLAEIPQLMKEKEYLAHIKYDPTGKKTRYPLIVTANFDQALECAFIQAKQPFDLVYYQPSLKEKEQFIEEQFLNIRFDHKNNTDRAIVPKNDQDPQPVSPDRSSPDKKTEYGSLSLNERPVILKLYGPAYQDAIQKQGFAITEDHFIEYLTRQKISELLPSNLKSKLEYGVLWFLEYSLSFWNLRVIINRIWPHKNYEKHYEKWWAIHTKPGLLDEKLWELANVDLRKTESLTEYVKSLNECLRKYPRWSPKKRR